MSTLIDNAYKLTGIATLGEFFSFINGSFRQELTRARDFLDAKHVLSGCVKFLDDKNFRIDQLRLEGYEGELFIDKAISLILKDLSLGAGALRKRLMDFSLHSFSASIGYDEVEDSLLIITNNTEPEYQNTLINTLGFKEWGYTDQTDKPEGVTEEEWKQREQSWNRVLKTGDTIEEMIEFKLSNEEFTSVRLGDIAECIKTIKDNSDTFFPADIIRQVWDREYSDQEKRSKRLSMLLLIRKTREQTGDFQLCLKNMNDPVFEEAIYVLSQKITPYLPSYSLEEISDMDTTIEPLLTEKEMLEIDSMTKSVVDTHLSNA